MTRVFGSLVGYEQKIEDDGAVVIRARPFDGDEFDIIITPDEIAEVIGLFQTALIQRHKKAGADIPAPTLSILGCQAGFSPSGSGIMAATSEMGTVVLRGETPALRALIRAAETVIERQERPAH